MILNRLRTLSKLPIQDMDLACTLSFYIFIQLKSTAHLPWRMMTYKALNTFIDDLFAFVIQMPTLYRIGNVSKTQ